MAVGCSRRRSHSATPQPTGTAGARGAEWGGVLRCAAEGMALERGAAGALSGGHKQKRPVPLPEQAFCVLVRLAGIEPTTPWFVAKYSIQLSYSRQAVEYSANVQAFFQAM